MGSFAVNQDGRMRSHFCPHRKVCESGVCTTCVQERLAMTGRADIAADVQGADATANR
jgi:hypothetical protein